jgi:carboxypeptidase Taq
MGNHFDKLRRSCGTVFDLAASVNLLEWDQQTYMPAGGAQGRAYQIATLSRLAHERFVGDEFAAELESAESEVASLDPDSDEARIVARLRRDVEKRKRVSADWVEEHELTIRMAFSAWVKARAASDFASFKPHLEKVLGLKRSYVAFFAPYENPYDPLLDNYEPGMKTSTIKAIFARLREVQVPLVAAVTERAEAVDDSFLHQKFNDGAQWDFGLAVIRDFGYDFERGRQDKAPHPFSISFNRDDVRITNRINGSTFGPTLFGSMHESGHAMYSQGLPASLDRIPVISGFSLDSSHHASLGIHESQSRMMENLVGRSREFWQAYYPRLQAAFPGHFDNVPVERFYRAINRVKPSLIRVEADEATYNLHIMLRFEIELDLMQGNLAVADLPEAWNSKMQAFFGLTPTNDALGVLQDIHWSDGYFGYFPTYTLGNLTASQLWQTLEQELPNIRSQIASGKFHDLLAWLREKIHRHGAKFQPMELLERVTGAGLSPEPYLTYLQTKYGEIYGLG